MPDLAGWEVDATQLAQTQIKSVNFPGSQPGTLPAPSMFGVNPMSYRSRSRCHDGSGGSCWSCPGQSKHLRDSACDKSREHGSRWKNA